MFRVNTLALMVVVVGALALHAATNRWEEHEQSCLEPDGCTVYVAKAKQVTAVSNGREFRIESFKLSLTPDQMAAYGRDDVPDSLKNALQTFHYDGKLCSQVEQDLNTVLEIGYSPTLQDPELRNRALAGPDPVKVDCE